MLFWSIQISITSILLIVLVHYLMNYFKSMLTVPKIKDLVITTNKNYEKIYETLNTQNEKQNEKGVAKNEYNDYMKNELKNFINQTTNPGTTGISGIPGIPGTTSISREVQGISAEKDWGGMNFTDESSSKKKISFLKESLLS